MKKLFTLAVSIVMSSSIFAAAEFFIKINAPGNYTVSLNNQTITSPSNTFRFFDLYPGNYALKIKENGFSGRIILDKPVSIIDGYRTVAELDGYYNLSIIDQLPFVQKSWYVDNILSGQPGYGAPFPQGPKPCQIPPKPPCGNGHTGQNQGHHYGNGYNNYPGNGSYGYNNGNLLDDNSLQILLQTMKNVTFDDKMVEVAKTALKNRQVKTSQVHQMLSQFSFEQNKLQLAVYCYDKTIDKNNYYTLYNDFSFSSYSSELDKYINSR